MTILRIKEFNGTIENVAWCNRKSEKFKMAAAKTGNTYISASRPGSNAVPTAIPTFSVSRNSMALVWMLGGVTESRKKFKMAAAKPEIRISQLLNQIETPFQRLFPRYRYQGTQWR